jgi:hypothetical protein
MDQLTQQVAQICANAHNLLLQAEFSGIKGGQLKDAGDQVAQLKVVIEGFVDGRMVVSEIEPEPTPDKEVADETV